MAQIRADSVMTALIIFGSTFILVFALGFQSLNVNNGHYKAAFFTSFAIALSNLILLKTVPQANWLEIAAYLTSGPFAIITSMWAHKRLVKQKATKVAKPAEWPEPPANEKNGNVENYNPVPQPRPMRWGRK
jgi:hypothetical protein